MPASGTQQKNAKQYEKIQLILSLTETLLTIVLILFFVIFDYSRALREWVGQAATDPYVRLLLFSVVVGGGFSLITVPFSYISGFWLEHHYGLSNQRFLQWVWEQMKAFLVGIVLFLPVFLVFYYFLRNYPETWWLLTATILFLFSVVLGRIAPQIIFPLFYKFERLDDEDLLQRMRRLAKEGRFRLDGIFRFNMSKNTRKANAAFTGLGKSKRIILGDTLLDSFTHEEIESVFAHEVGHYVHRHLWIGIITGTLSSYLSLYLAHIIYKLIVFRAGYSGLDDLAVLPVLAIILSLITFFVSPVSNALSRRHERQADRYALLKSSEPAAFISALEKLAEINLADKSPHPVVEFLFHGHPSLGKRIRFARAVLES